MKKIQLSSMILLAVFTTISCKKVGPEEVKTTNYVVVSTIAGGSGSGSAGGFSDGIGALAAFNNVVSMVVDTKGNIYLSDEGNSRIRKITPAGDVSTFAGGNNDNPNALNGTGTAARFNSPNGMVIDAAGNLYVAEMGNSLIRKITPDAVVTTYAGSGQDGYLDGPAATAKFSGPSGLGIDKAGNLYVGDTYNKVIRKITPAGMVSTYACTYQGGYSNFTPYDGPAAGLKFNLQGPAPSGLTVDPSGNVYVADWFNQFVYKITPEGMASTIGALQGDRVQEGPSYLYKDGNPKTARFNYPRGLACDANGNVYVADQYNNRIRKIAPNGIVSTIAGNGITADVDGSPSQSSFFAPSCVALDAKGSIYVGETSMVRKIETIIDTAVRKNVWSNPQSWGNPK